jgi:hypothetical protein
MTEAHWKVAQQKKVQIRRKLLQQARALARSGRHESHKSIFADLEPIDGFAETRTWIGESAIRAQLDKLCVMARERQVGQAYRRVTFAEARLSG